MDLDAGRDAAAEETLNLLPVTQDQEPLCLQPSWGWGSLELTNFCSYLED